MRIRPQVEKQFISGLRAQTLKGDGFSVRILFPFAVRYEECGRLLTVSAEPVAKERAWAFYLPPIARALTSSTWLDVAIEKPLFWDNTTEGPVTSESVIIGRIEKALDQAGFGYTIRRVSPPNAE